MVKPIDTTKELLEDYISYSFMEGNIDENTMSILTKEVPNYIDQLNELKLLNIPLVIKCDCCDKDITNQSKLCMKCANEGFD